MLGVKGDVNGDGGFTVADLVAMQGFLLGRNDLAVWQNGDLCSDGKINVYDMCLLRRLFVNG